MGGLSEPMAEIKCGGNCKRPLRLTNTCCHYLFLTATQCTSIRQQSLSSFPEHSFSLQDLSSSPSLLCALCLPFPLSKSASGYWVYHCSLPFRDTCLWCLITGLKPLLCVKRIVRAGGKSTLESGASSSRGRLSHWLLPLPPMPLAAFPLLPPPPTHCGEKALLQNI